MIKRILKLFGMLLLAIMVVGLVVFFIVDEPLPEGTPGPEAEALADEMLAALNKPAFDSLKYIEFTFAGRHSFEWDKENNTVVVMWDENEVFLDLKVNPENYDMLEYTAYKYFVNDSFWLVAPFKVRDEGVTRSKVDLISERGLLVNYSSGGVTPGDSYLWILDDSGFPIAWEIWASIVPVGGLRFSWEEWIQVDDTYLSTLHQSSIVDLKITNLDIK